VRKRIAATSNVAQLTGVMKLVAASKLKGVEDRLEDGRPFGTGLMNSVSFRVSVDPEEDDYEEDVSGDASKKIMFMVMTTDRGLCGGVNSQIIRAAKAQYSRYKDAGHDTSVRDTSCLLAQLFLLPILHHTTSRCACWRFLVRLLNQSDVRAW